MANSLRIENIFDDVDDSLKNILIENIKIFKSENKIVISISSDEALTDGDVLKIKELFLNMMNTFDVEIESEDNICEIDKDSIILQISSELSIEDYNFQINFDNNNIYLKFFVDVDKDKIIKLKTSLKNKNLNLYVEYWNNDNSKDEFLSRIKDEESKLDKKMLIESRDVKNKTDIKCEDVKPLTTYRKKPKKEPEFIRISDINIESGTFKTDGKIFNIEYKEISNGEKEIMTIYYSDNTESTYLKVFLKKEESERYKESIKTGMGITVIGQCTYDTFQKSDYIKPSYFEVYEIVPRKDLSENKRVELHVHTNMSAQDGINSATDLINRAKYWGHKAIAITDHSVVQAFPEAMNASIKAGVKILYGSELNVVDDEASIIKNDENLNDSYDNFVVFDLETTGFSSINDKIIEIGAVKISNGEIIDSFNQLINPKVPLKEDIIKLTNIDDAMLIDKPTIEEALPKFYEFIKNSILVAHNATFDIGFIKNNCERNNLPFNNPYIDTLELSRILFPNVRSHKLSNVAKRLGVSLENAHRAVDDARATGEVFIKLIGDGFVNDNFTLTLKNIANLKEKREKHIGSSYHVVALAKNEIGLKNLYHIISKSHIDYFYYNPRVPKSLLDEYKEGLIFGSACQDGALFQSILKSEPKSRIMEIAKDFDYLEIQPKKNNYNLIPEYFNDEKDLEKINMKIVEIGDELNIPVVATGDVHYLDSESLLSRKILKYSLNSNMDEYDNDYSMMTTEEMLDEFSYLGDRAYEVVVENTNKIADSIESFKPIPDGTFPPSIEGSDENLKKITYKRAHEIYGENLPKIVEDRLKVELNSIINNGYSELYIIAKKLVEKANSDGYQVGSRGSVGSSFVATMCGITEVNPLKPHYVCPKCKKSEFIDTKKMNVFSGHDLPEKKCEDCNVELNRFGDEIPFEVFLGFDGDKEPDIDLNFAGEYQSTAHKYTEVIFGKGKVFRAGTIGTIAEKTAYGYVLKYKREKEENFSKAEVDRLALSLVGIKRTTGQHAGGVMIVPANKDIHDFTPIQKPANDKNTDIITTHFDYNAISGKILKLDILGHDVPSMIKIIEEMTNTNFMKVPMNDKNVLSLFSSSKALNFDEKIYSSDIGTLGVPEFGTPFVQKMLKKTKPTTFAELVRISGLSHGTNVWNGNAEELVDSNKATLKDVISTREDIMQDLIRAGAEKKFAFTTMEHVRKGKLLTPEETEIISKLDLPDWYTDSLNKISYMFPKAHAVAYVSMSVRLAYYKLYYPAAFYATYLSTKISNFDLLTILKGPETIKKKMGELNANTEISNKEKADIPIYEIALELYSRGCEFAALDLYKSKARQFSLEDGKILPPFTTVPSLGDSVADAIVEERNLNKFLSIEDLMNRTKTSKTVIENLKLLNVLNDLNDSNQLSFF